MIKEIDCSISVLDFVSRLQAEDVAKISTIRRRVTFDKLMLEALELTFHGNTVPSHIVVSSFEFPFTPVSLKPIRCFYCQRYRHTETQCRSRYPRCVFCREVHELNKCPFRLRNAVCCNCSGSHPAFSDACPVYQRETEIQKIRTQLVVGYQEAEDILSKQTPDNSLSESDKTIVKETDDRGQTNFNFNTENININNDAAGNSYSELDTSFNERLNLMDFSTSKSSASDEMELPLQPQWNQAAAMDFIIPPAKHSKFLLIDHNKRRQVGKWTSGNKDSNKISPTISSLPLPPSPTNEIQKASKKALVRSPSI